MTLEECKTLDPSEQLCCTLPLDHAGSHAAHETPDNSDDPVAVWE